jgi:hypothetical protein
LTLITYLAQSSIWFCGCPIQQVHNTIIRASPKKCRYFTGLSQIDQIYRHVTDKKCCREIFDFVRGNYKNTEVHINSLSTSCETQLWVLEHQNTLPIWYSNILLLITFQSNWQQIFPKFSCHLKRTRKGNTKGATMKIYKCHFVPFVLRSLQNCAVMYFI